MTRLQRAQSRVAAPTLGNPRPPPLGPTYAPNRDGHYWCCKCTQRAVTHASLHRAARWDSGGRGHSGPLCCGREGHLHGPSVWRLPTSQSTHVQQVLPAHSFSHPGHRRLHYGPLGAVLDWPDYTTCWCTEVGGSHLSAGHPDTPSGCATSKKTQSNRTDANYLRFFTSLV